MSLADDHTVHRRGAIRELQERLYLHRGIYLMSTAESYLAIEQHQFPEPRSNNIYLNMKLC